jgi:hypothetical protein
VVEWPDGKVTRIPSPPLNKPIAIATP